MATSGTVNTSKTSDGYRYASLSWTQTSSGNVSTISWTAYIKDTRTSNNEWYMTSDVSFTVSCSKGTSSISSKTIMGSTRVEQRPGQIGSGSFKITHNSSGEAKFTITLKAAIYTYDVTNTGSETWTLPTLISACGAPTSVTLTPAIVAPGGSITVKWSGATAGNNNTINGYQVYYRVGSAPTKSASDSNKSVASSASSTTFTIPSTATRGSKVYAGVVTKGSAGSTYYSGIKTSSAIAINKLPAAPAISMPGTISASSIQVTASSISAGSDVDGQACSVYYTIDSSSTKAAVPSNKTFAFDSSSDSHTYHFYTYDGLEYSSSTDRTVTKNVIPTGNIIGATPSLFNFGGSNGASGNCAGYASFFSVIVANSNKAPTSLKLKYRLSYSYTPATTGSWINTQGELSPSAYTSNNEPLFQVNIYSLIGLTKITQACSWKMYFSLYDGIDESATITMVPSTTNYYYTIPGVPAVINSYNQFANENIANSDSGKIYRRIRAIFTKDDSLTTYEVKTTSGTSSDIDNVIIAQGAKSNSEYYLDIELSEEQPANNTINFVITGKNNFIEKTLATISKTTCKTLPAITGIASLNGKIFSPFSSPSAIEISLTNPFSDQDFRSTYAIGDNGIILQVSRGTYMEETPLSGGQIESTILKFSSSETALFDVKKISSSNPTVLGLGVQNLQGTYTCTARLKIQNLYGAVVYSENFKCGPAGSQEDFFTLNFNQAGTCSIPTINSNQIKYRYSAQGTDSSFTTSKYVQEGMYLTIPVTYKGYTVESTVVSLSLLSGSTTYAAKSVTFDSAIPSISSSSVNQYTVTSNITFENIGELDVNKLSYDLKVMGFAGAVDSSGSIQRAAVSSSNYFNSIPFTTPTIELSECTFTNEENYTLDFKFNYSSDGLPPSMSYVTSSKVEALVDAEDTSTSLGSTAVSSWPSGSTIGEGTLVCDSSQRGWDYKSLVFKLTTSVTNDGHTITKNILSNNLLVFHGRPLVAYRKQHLGINTGSPESDSLLDVHAMEGNSKIYLQDDVNEKKWTIDVTNGTIAFASESAEQWRLPYTAGNGISISSGQISVQPNLYTASAPISIDSSRNISIAVASPLTINNNQLDIAIASPLAINNSNQLDIAIASPFTINNNALNLSLASPIVLQNNSISLATNFTGDTSFAPGAQTPGFGSTFTIPNIVFDMYGRAKSLTTSTVKIPNAAVTTSAAGLMSAADKVKLNNWSDLSLNGGSMGNSYSAVNFSSGTIKNAVTTTLESGLWLIKASIIWAKNATGRRAVMVSQTSASDEWHLWDCASQNAVSGSYTYTNLITFLNLSASRTIYITGYQNSGASLDGTPRFGAFRIGVAK